MNEPGELKEISSFNSEVVSSSLSCNSLSLELINQYFSVFSRVSTDRMMKLVIGSRDSNDAFRSRSWSARGTRIDIVVNSSERACSPRSARAALLCFVTMT